jgi:outer membrane protein insertion porin family/translocation and assembly module TamA
VKSRLVPFVVVVAAIAVLGGCKTVPEGRSAVDEVTVRGTNVVSSGDIESKIATTESPKFLALFRGVLYDYSLFDRFVLQRDLARIEALYRARGFWDAHARAGRVIREGDQHVRVEIVVEEGEPVLVRKVHVEVLGGLPPDVQRAVERAVKGALPIGRRFEEDAYEKAAGTTRRALSDRGYAYAKVTRDAAVDLVAHRADVVLTVEPGPPCTFGDLTIEGLAGLPDAPVRRAIDIRPGSRYSEAELDSAQQAVLDLGVFAAVSIEPELPDPPRPDHVVPVRAKVEPTRLRTIALGGGVELDALKADVHGLVRWEDRNFLGGMRTFSVRFRPGLVLHPVRVNNLTTPDRFLPEERLRLELRQPGLFEPRTTGFVRPELDVYPVLLNPDPLPDAPVLGYVESRNAVGVDRTLWKLYGALSHNVQFDAPFPYVGPRDPTLANLLISYPELFTTLDFRDDKVHPRLGVWIGNTLQLAGGPFAGDADDLKIQPDVRGYVPLSKRFVLAMRASVGFLYPRNYGRYVRERPSVFGSQAERTHDYQLVFFRGFFSGGPTQNRGYALRGVGPQDVVPFLTPQIAAQNINQGCGDQCRTPTGGFTLWEASAELRIDVTGPLSVATFCDASDVSPQTTDIRLRHPHLSCGPGVRYDTPVGPIRLDVGYRIPGMQVLGGLTPDEREPDTLFGIPIAVAFGIGEAF